MAKSRPSIAKRKRELALQDKKRRKRERRAEKSSQQPTRLGTDSDFDPDIAHIVPGPQPLPWDDQGVAPLEATSDSDNHSDPGR